MKHVLILLGLLSSLVGYSQSTVKGIVRGENNEPIEGATLVYRKDITIGAQTDAKGAYELFLPSGAVNVVVRFSGMRNDTLSLNLAPNEVVEVNVILKP
ncbi:MAG: carboxypeptidase regulatory-like domain-containing protein, partial [Flavobacteriales bacterium]